MEKGLSIAYTTVLALVGVLLRYCSGTPLTETRASGAQGGFVSADIRWWSCVCVRKRSRGSFVRRMQFKCSSNSNSNASEPGRLVMQIWKERAKLEKSTK
ncbi:jg6427 [Pararge aegeria aegeria]|uniref:Jg6427 protein n=1 Tax=Pararge aegeria aegeria TaxID=348720 RepID=A0A8S4S5K7_9NEOP|nr:jg6427 [Pararge aegeria aegeria]